MASGSCPSPHYLDGPHNLRCAFSEGFADYHGAATRPDLGSYIYRSRIESNAYYPGTRYHGSDGDPNDGSIIEGAVAAFLYDLTDPANESHDQVQYPGSYVADIIRTCKTPVYRANGVDHLVYCFEQIVDSAISSSYFRTRSSPPSSISESATEPAGWSRSAIRTLWLRNLYGQ